MSRDSFHLTAQIGAEIRARVLGVRRLEEFDDGHCVAYWRRLDARPALYYFYQGANTDPRDCIVYVPELDQWMATYRSIYGPSHSANLISLEEMGALLTGGLPALMKLRIRGGV